MYIAPSKEVASLLVFFGACRPLNAFCFCMATASAAGYQALSFTESGETSKLCAVFQRRIQQTSELKMALSKAERRKVPRGEGIRKSLHGNTTRCSAARPGWFMCSTWATLPTQNSSCALVHVGMQLFAASRKLHFVACPWGARGLLRG